MTNDIGEQTTLDELLRLAEERAKDRDEAVQRSLNRVIKAGQDLRMMMERSHHPPSESARLLGVMLNLTLEVAAKLEIDPAGGMILASRE
jgi:hypothetical protein